MPSRDTTALHPPQSHTVKYLSLMKVSRGPSSEEEGLMSIVRTEPDGTENSSAQGSIMTVVGTAVSFLKVYLMKASSLRCGAPQNLVEGPKPMFGFGQIVLVI